MPMEQLPQYILRDILKLVVQDEYQWSQVLALRLVSRCFNLELEHAIYHRDLLDIHSKTIYGPKPSRIALQRIVKGFILRYKDLPNNLKRNIRPLWDGASIFSLLSRRAKQTRPGEEISTVHASGSTLRTAPSCDENCDNSLASRACEAQHKSGDYINDTALLSVCKAYIALLGSKLAFESLDPTPKRDRMRWKKLEDKSGHFWALLAAICAGRAQIVQAAADACIDKFTKEPDSFNLKTHFAAALLVAAKQGNFKISKLIIARYAVKISLRFQNIRFADQNAIEVAIERNHSDIVHLLLDHGWNLTFMPLDYRYSLDATISVMKESPLRNELLEILLEGDCLAWRNDSILVGILTVLCKRGDLKTCQRIASLLRTTSNPNSDEAWAVHYDLTNDFVISDPAPADTVDQDFIVDSYSGTAEDTALYKAIVAGHNHMIDFLIENSSLLPESMSESFGPTCIWRCLEYSVVHRKQDTLISLLAKESYLFPQNPVIRLTGQFVCLRQLILLAVCHGNLPAVEALACMVDLKQVIKKHDGFEKLLQHDLTPFTLSHGGTTLSDMMHRLEGSDNPHSFLPICHPIGRPHNIKLGTFLLVTAIKFLHLDVTEYLLSKSCTIGRPITLVSRSMITTHHARLWLPHEASTCDDCTSAIPHSTKPWPLILLTLSLSPWSIKRMIESGVPIRSLSDPRIITVTNFFRPWRWKQLASSLSAVDAKIISAIQIPFGVWNEGREDDMERRLAEMKTLMRRWRLPDVYFYRTYNIDEHVSRDS